jgi:DNA-binding PadR family transcriptional regulator
MIRQFISNHHHGHRHGGDDSHGGGRRFRGRFTGDFSRGMGPGRTRRGDVKYLVLEVVAEAPRHGYEIIGAIEEKRGFRPSAGSIYPTLQMLDDGGFVTSAEVDGKRVYTITDTGRELLANRSADADGDDDAGPDARHKLKASTIKLGAAVMGIRGSDDATLDRVRAILDRARKEIYGILATDES